MSVKPVLSKLGCRRLGTRANSQRPRKLLVHLESESTVADLLRDAKRLRLSEDAAVASSVYINPDWSPAERKLAYVQRQQRRSAKQTRVKTVLLPPQLNRNLKQYLPDLSTFLFSQTTYRICSSCLLNARSIVNKTCELHYMLYTGNYEILLVTETWLNDGICDGFLDPRSMYHI